MLRMTWRNLVARKVRRAYLIGESAGAFGEALGDIVPTVPSGTLGQAVAAASAAAAPGEVVVLSPACASFDQFRDFRDRGEQFARAVAALGTQAEAEAAHG